MATGFVSLIGAGPGDPLLITIRGRRALERADVVLYDYLASASLLETVPVPGQLRLHVGKAAGEGRITQEDINRLIVQEAKAGKRVARLKGGDPFVFGRGSEEARICARADIPFEVIPGVSSIHSVPAYVGIPLTDRSVASGFTVLTGHERWDSDAKRIDWTQVAGTGGTIVILMGVLQIKRWTRGLLDGGLSPDTPVALIRWGTTPKQELLTSTLGDAARAAELQGLRPPAVAIVGQSVDLKNELSWLHHRPLAHCVIGLTRSKTPDGETYQRLEDLGATLFHLPMTHQVGVRCPEVAVALAEPANTDIVFTSANGVSFFKEALRAAELDARDLADKRVWAVGPSTARACYESLGLRADHVPDNASAKGLVELASELGVAGRGFIFPAARAARETLEEGLRAQHATVQRLTVYETQPTPNAAERLRDALAAGLNLGIVASPSAVDALAAAVAEAGLAPDTLPLAAVGPTTAAHARKAGFKVVLVPKEHTMAALADELAEMTTKETR